MINWDRVFGKVTVEYYRPQIAEDLIKILKLLKEVRLEDIFNEEFASFLDRKVSGWRDLQIKDIVFNRIPVKRNDYSVIRPFVAELILSKPGIMSSEVARRLREKFEGIDPHIVMIALKRSPLVYKGVRYFIIQKGTTSGARYYLEAVDGEV